MAPRPKPEKKPIFTERFWDRPEPREKGDANGDVIAQAVGYALSRWEQADQALANLFVKLCDCTTVQTFNAIRRAYGSIESNTGRRNAVLAAAEIYFGAYWSNKLVKQSLIDIVNAVQWASKRRDDIAHGIIWGNLKVDEVNYGSFLMPPEYNTGRSHAFMEDSPDPLRFMRAKYRYTAADISEVRKKFTTLDYEIGGYSTLIQRSEGRFPILEHHLEPLMDKSEKKR